MTVEDVRQFSRVYTGAIADILDELHEEAYVLPSAIAALTPGMRLAGFAFPVRGEPRRQPDYDQSIRKILAMLGAVTPGAVVVYETADRTSAHLGELSAAALVARGCHGAVVDGGVRDVHYIVETGLPVFTRYVTPVDCVPRWDLLEWNTACTVGDVTVTAGDIIVGDEDGVVRIPRRVADQVLAACHELVATENEVRSMVKAGVNPLEAYERYGKF
jgi:4-hydroxy-4-methyl-2-oxoglutarate aldolase